jgi:hypothetical protein
MYIHLSYEDYKEFERQCRAFVETKHTTSGTAFYHKAMRVKINDGLIMEFHGPLVGGPQQHTEGESER